MVQVLEYPWNGQVIDGGLPNVSTPTTTANPFYFFHTRNSTRVRVYLNPRIVMPVGTSTIPSGVVTQLTAIANAAVATVSGTTLATKIEWALMGATEPTSATESRRPRVGWVETFWAAVDDVVGAHAATWGYAILTQPRTVDMWEANADPDASMATWANKSWGPNDGPSGDTGPWLEALTREVVTHLRANGATKNIVVPAVYAPGSANPVKDAHPSGPWVNDANTWYEAIITPMGTDGYSVTKPYAAYNTSAASIDPSYRDVWLESAYFAESVGAVSVLDALDLNPPSPIELPPETAAGAVALPPTSVEAAALNGGAHITWVQPTYFGDGEFLNYQVEITGVGNELLKAWNVTALSINAGPFDNGTVYTASVYTVTTEGFSDAASSQFTPLASAGDPVGGWYQQPTDDDGSVTVVVAPEPLVEAFPQERNFRPANWGLTPDEVPEGF